jgi:hypothetical protein
MQIAMRTQIENAEVSTMRAIHETLRAASLLSLVMIDLPAGEGDRALEHMCESALAALRARGEFARATQFIGPELFHQQLRDVEITQAA